MLTDQQGTIEQKNGNYNDGTTAFDGLQLNKQIPLA